MGYSDKALLYAEKYGVIEYKVTGSEMIYYSSWPSYKTTYKCIVDLDTGEEYRTPCNRYYKGRIGSLQVGYNL